MEETDKLPGTLDSFCDTLRQQVHTWELMLARGGFRSYDLALKLGSHCALLRKHLCEIFESAWLRCGEREPLLPIEQLIERCADLEGKAKEIRNDLAPMSRRIGTNT